ncbi:hypothetical protein DMP14_31545 [Pseudonocardia sp. Ae707_Ps2]|uniref:FtsK/SpoIIIE domain-containing protein n=1 Tax=unclassified Pseudonocardia TaxID=2619320 RepID=UPI00094AD69C|nr:FtsK/SpoIIIE domain-containing protein [Pseudonocardia sp. Ae406_Ps2]
MARNKGGGRLGKPIATYPIGWWFVGQALGVTWRFLAGQVVTRRPGRWDSRYLTWAAEVPESVALSREEGIPRSRWARRPGWQRQTARFAAIALLAGFFVWPVPTVALLVVGAVTTAVRKALDLRELAYYHRVCGRFLQWTAGRVGWGDVSADPREWIELPAGGLRWEPVAPLRTAVLAAGAGERAGWLTRLSPALAGCLRPLAAPVAEWRWVLWLTAPRDGLRPWRSMLAALVGRLVIRTAEVSRLLRVRPRWANPDLGNADTEIVIHYPATYQAHGEDVKEVERVVTSRLPGGPWKSRNSSDDLTITIYHPESLPREITWGLDIFERHSQLKLPIGEMPGQKVISVDLKGQTPHINASGKTGRGKTVTFLTILGGFLYHGGHAVIVDPKKVDFVRPFRRLANVDLVTIQDRFPQVLKDMEAEMERRYEIIEELTERADELGMPEMEKNAELYFQPLFLAIDEKSGFTAKCTRWWKTEGNDGNPGKGPSETIEWERNLVARGRAAAVFVMAAAQQNAIPMVFPDTDIRSNYQYKILAGPADGPSWVVTFPGTRRRKLSSDVKGRAIVGVGEDLHEVQLAYMDPTVIREAAERGLEVQDQLNLERAERLAKISGRPLWEVSPLPWWVSRPAQTTETVPGQVSAMDTGAPVINMTPPMALVPAAQDDSDDETINAENEAVAPYEPAAESNAGSTGAGSEDTAEVDADTNVSSNAAVFGAVEDAPERIRGNGGAAEFLGVRLDTFRRARTRAEKRGDSIPGMATEGRFVTFDRVQLAEWWSQRPGSGRKAG